MVWLDRDTGAVHLNINEGLLYRLQRLNMLKEVFAVECIVSPLWCDCLLSCVPPIVEEVHRICGTVLKILMLGLHRNNGIHKY